MIACWGRATNSDGTANNIHRLSIPHHPKATDKSANLPTVMEPTQPDKRSLEEDDVEDRPIKKVHSGSLVETAPDDSTQPDGEEAAPAEPSAPVESSVSAESSVPAGSSVLAEPSVSAEPTAQQSPAEPDQGDIFEQQSLVGTTLEVDVRIPPTVASGRAGAESA